MMKRRYLYSAAALLLCAAASAQNLNPTVQVTNAYEGRALDVEKQNVAMAVPDSLLKFDWDFGYSVFDNPYKGAYEFSPYLIEMRPDPTVYDGKKFYLRAGAGYSLHPQLQAVWSPEIKGPWGLTVYDDLKGYWGDWYDMTPVSIGSGTYRTSAGDTYKGADLANKLGFLLRRDGAKTVLSLDGKFKTLFMQEDSILYSDDPRYATALGASGTFRVRSAAPSDFAYDFSLNYDWTGDALEAGVYVPLDHSEHELGAKASFGYSFALHNSVALEALYDRTMYSGQSSLSSSTYGVSLASDRVDVAPAYEFSSPRFRLHAGIRYSQVWTGTDTEETDSPDYKGRNLYPDFNVSFVAVKDALVIGAALTGGQKFNTYRSFLESNHHFPVYLSDSYPYNLADASVNTFDASLSAGGSAFSRLQYSVKAGYARWYNAPLDGMLLYSRVSGTCLIEHCSHPLYYMTNYDRMYATADVSWHSDRLDVEGALTVQKSQFRSVTTALSLPRFQGSAAMTYNWNRRIFAGISAEWMTKRYYDDEHALPLYNDYRLETLGWVDLGVNLEYRTSRKFSLWAEGGNLLGQPVMRNLLFVEKGPYFTVGICLNL